MRLKSNHLTAVIKVTYASIMVIDLDDFKARAKQEAQRRGIALHTLSKKLFKGSPQTLPNMFKAEKPTFPRVDTMIGAQQALEVLEGETVEAA